MNRIKEMEDYINQNYLECDFYTLYSFTTENINGYMDLFDLKNKSLLTVGSSADQVINAGLVGCKDITLFDICPLTKYFYYLKLAALLTLERDEFLRFLCKTKYQKNTESNPNLFRKSLFNKTKKTLKSLDYESYIIWDYLFNNFKGREINRLFRIDVNQVNSIIGCNRYLINDDNYKLAREKVLDIDIKFREGNVLDPKLTKKYDNIWLSNIWKYLNEENLEIMFKKMSDCLNTDGKMLMAYFYYASSPDDYENVFNKYDYIREIIDGEPFNTYENSVLVYKKNN